jgi:hypothetical protein
VTNISKHQSITANVYEGPILKLNDVLSAQK